MTTSASNDWELNCNKIIARALRLIGAVAQGDVPSAEQTQEAREALNSVIHRLQKRKTHLWSVSDDTITTAAGTQGYNLDADTIEIAYLKYREGTGASATDDPIKLVGSLEWQNISQLAYQNGDPIMAYFDQASSPKRLLLWPVPNSIRTIYFRKTRALYDFDSALNTPDFPQHWNDALCYALAATLGPEYQVPIEELRDLRAEARRLIKDAQEDDVEPTDDAFVQGAY